MARGNFADLNVQLSATTVGFVRSMDMATRKLQSFGDSVQRVANTSTKILAGLGLAGGYFVKVASDAKELENVISKSFGDSAGAVNEWAKTTGKALNRSTYQMREFVGTSKSMFKSLVRNDKLSTEMARSISKLSVDFGSFKNISDSRAFEVLTAALMGEADGLKRLGYNLTDTALKDYLLRKGIKKSTETMSIGEKTVHRYNLLMEVMSDIHGDATDTAGELANSSKGLLARIRNISEEFGEKLYPAANKFVNVLNVMLDKFIALDPEVKNQILKWGLITAGVLSGAVAFGVLVSAVSLVGKSIAFLWSFGSALLPVILVGGALAAVGGLIYAAWNENWGGIRDKLISAFDAVRQWWDESHLKASLEKGLQQLKEIWTDDNLDFGQKTIKTLEVAVGVIKAVALDAIEIISSNADLVKTGLQIPVSLQLAATTVSLLLSAISSALGGQVSKTASILAVLSVGIALVEAAGGNGSWKDVGSNIIAGLIAGFAAAGLTGSPQAGVLVFTVALNFELGNKISDWIGKVDPLKGIRELIGTEEDREAINTVVGYQASPDKYTNLDTSLTQTKSKNFKPDEVLRYLDVLEKYKSATDALANNNLPAAAQYLSDALNKIVPANKFMVDTKYNELEELAKKAAIEISKYLQLDMPIFVNAKVTLDKFDFSSIPHLRKELIIPEKNHDGAIYGFSQGGFLPGTAGPDQFLAMLAPGEAVVPSSAMRKGAGGIMQWFKKQGVPGFAKGMVPSITGSAGVDISAVDTYLKGLGAMVDKISKVMLKTFEIIGKFIVELAKKIFGEENVNMFLEVFEELKRALNYIPDKPGSSQLSSGEPWEMRKNDTEPLPSGTSFFDTVGQTLKGLAGNMYQSAPIAQKAVEGFQTGGVAGLFTALISESETFAQLMEIINPILQAAADMLGMLIQPLLPIIQVLESALTPVFEALGMVLATALEPAFKALFPVIKFLGVALLFVTEIFMRARAWIMEGLSKLINGLGQFLDKIWAGLGTELIAMSQDMANSAKDAKESADDLKESRDTLNQLTYDGAMAQATQNKELEKANEFLRNAVTGIKVNLYRFNAAQGVDVKGNGYRTNSSSQTNNNAGSDVTINVNRPVYGVDDFRKIIREELANYINVTKLNFNGA